MSTSGTYTFNPALAELVMNAFSRIGIPRTALMQEHLVNARLETNLQLQAWSNLGVNLWAVDLQTLPLVAGTATYTLADETVTLLDVYLQINGATTADRILMPLSRSEYAALPDKTSTGNPVNYWFNKQISPTVTFWRPPDNSSSYVIKYYRMRAIQDANIAGGETLDLPDRFVDAFVAGLAHRLARHHAPDKEAIRKQDADEAWRFAGGADVERVPMYVTPGFDGYFR